MSDMKPCPFCGGEAKEHAAFASRSGVGVYVECGVCGAQSRTFWGDGAQDEAVGAWSRRAERTCGELRGYPRCDAIGHAAAHEDDELWCEHCDIELDDSWSYCPHCGARVTEVERRPRSASRTDRFPPS